MAVQQTILLAGGGSGGHIFPNLAVAERLRDLRPEVESHLLISLRPLDAEIAQASGLAYTAIDAAPLILRPGGFVRFLRDFRRGQRQVRQLIAHTQAKALLATGGFVSGPAVRAAAAAKLPVALISLDASPGWANRLSARQADAVFTAFPGHAGGRQLPRSQVSGYPLRRAATTMSTAAPAAARMHFGLDPDRLTLLVFAGSQGARTINQALLALITTPPWQALASRVQVLHISGGGGGGGSGGGGGGGGDTVKSVKEAYTAAGTRAVVLPFCHAMDRAWAAADVALTRAGAGTVAEAWANAVPSVMLPYPFHKDEHQRHNAQPLVDLGGAVVLTDRIDPAGNVAGLTETLLPLLDDGPRQARMRQALQANPPADGAEILARWLIEHLPR